MTSDDFECPHCGTGVDTGEIPDHLTNMTNNRFEYECDCGCSFEVSVDWDPVCYVDEGSIKLPAHGCR